VTCTTLASCSWLEELECEEEAVDLEKLRRRRPQLEVWDEED